ncbi:formin-homology 2 domain-containing protein [Achlya hypogyna]|uniref:Formin-homology 2 domain-containing protein n=1 Tax=Achlya hypogyna TaxID=1202772 RepID=A0A1V9Y4M5_ACHHY|nr:formin-homology 2 domain-containing protein [Achlya hypogyna]
MAPPPSPVKEKTKKKTTLSKSIAKVFRRHKPAASNNDSASTADAHELARPSDEAEIEELFVQAVEGMALPKAAAERMLLLPMNQKWQIVQDWAKKQTAGAKDPAEPLTWVHRLREAREDVASFSEEDARELHVLIRGSDKEWLTQFQKEDGFVALTDLTALFVGMNTLDPYATRLFECLRCFKSLMNNNVGMHLLLEHPETIHTLALSLAATTDSRREMTLMVLEMLSLTCWFSEAGHSAVVEAMELCRRRQNERRRFADLVRCIEVSESVALQAACLTFINTLVSTSARLEDRVHVRNDFLALDLLVLCYDVQARLRGLVPATLSYGMWGYGDAEQHAAAVFTKQTQVFESLMRADMEETACAGLDLGDVGAVLSRLVAAAADHGVSDRLLHVALALLVIPNEVSWGSKMWDFVEEATLEITSSTFAELGRKKLIEFHAIHAWLDESRELSAKYAQLEATEATFARQKETIAMLETNVLTPEVQSALSAMEHHTVLQVQLDEATAKVQSLDAQVAALRTQLDATKRAAAPAAVATKMTRADYQLPTKETKDYDSVVSDLAAPNPQYEKYFKLLKMGMPLEHVQLKVKADGLDPAKLASPPSGSAQLSTQTAPSALPTPPSAAPLVDARYEKYLKLAKMGMPLEQVKLKAKADGLDPSVLDNATSAPPSATVVSPAGAPSVSTSLKPSAPVKTTVPVSKLPPKKTPVSTAKMRNLYWTPLADACVEGSVWASMDESTLSLDWQLLEREFGLETGKREVAVGPSAPKPKVVHLVDAKRQQNCSIALSRFRMPPKDIKQAIVALDAAVLSLERVSILQGLVPTAEELDLVKGYEGDATLLGETEKFFLAVADVPRLAQRLEAMAIALSFAQHFSEIKGKLAVLEKARGCFKQPQALVQLLHIVLAVGNYMNGGTPRGGARGFKLEILPKLAQVKATSSATKTLLHVVVEVAVAKAPEAVRFFDALESIEAAAALSLAQLLVEFGSLSRGVALVHSELERQNEAFRRHFGSFVESAQKDLGRLQADLTAAEAKVAALVSRFGVDAKQPDGSQSFFQVWADFGRQFKAAMADNSARASKAAAEPHEDAGLFNQFSESLQGDATDIVAKLRTRHRHAAAPAAIASELALKLAHRRQSGFSRKA